MGKVAIVYTIKNKLSGRTYIGETTRAAETRFYEHKLDLTKGKERNKSLQKEYTELGANAFKFKVIIETRENRLCELLLIELFSRIGLGYKQKRGHRIQEVINGEEKIPEEVFSQIEVYLKRDFNKQEKYYLQLLEELNDIKENGFKCKSDDIYNREFKSLFLDGYAQSTCKVDESRFKKAARFEKQAQKDLYDFTLKEAEELLHFLKAKTLRSIQNHISRLSNYLEFAMKQGCSVNKVNYYKKLGKKEKAEKYLKWKYGKEID